MVVFVIMAEGRGSCDWCGFFLSSGIYIFFIIVVIIFYCDIYIILLC